MVRGRRIVVALAAVALAGTVVAGCGSDDDGSDRPSASGTGTTAGQRDGATAEAAADVDIRDFKFVPATVAVRKGGKVTWVNDDTAPHTAENATEAGPSKFKTGTLEKGDSKTVTFSEAGTYKYYCGFHRFMEADVVVK